MRAAQRLALAAAEGGTRFTVETEQTQIQKTANLAGILPAVRCTLC